MGILSQLPYKAIDSLRTARFTLQNVSQALYKARNGGVLDKILAGVEITAIFLEKKVCLLYAKTFRSFIFRIRRTRRTELSESYPASFIDLGDKTMIQYYKRQCFKRSKEGVECIYKIIPIESNLISFCLLESITCNAESDEYPCSCTVSDTESHIQVSTQEALLAIL